MKNFIGSKLEEKAMAKFGKTFLIFTLSCATAIGISQASKGESGGQFLRVGVGARAPGMAGAFSSIADDATAIYYNPAGMAKSSQRQVELSYNMYFQDTAAQFIGYVHPTEDRGAFGLGASLFGVDDIDRRSATGGDADVADLGQFKTQDMALAFGWANKLSLGSGRMHYGASLKYISSDLETEKAATAALDMGTIYNFSEEGGLAVSLAVLNLGGELKFDEVGDPLPLNVKPGVSYRMDLNRLGHLTLAMDSDMFVNDGVVFLQPGFKWWAHRMFALRGGYQVGRDEEAGNGLSVGTGFRIMSFSLDYAFVPFGDLGNTHRMSVGLKFGGSTDSSEVKKQTPNDSRHAGRTLSDF